MLVEERGLALRWRRQTERSAWMDPTTSHHASLLKPGDCVRMAVSRSRPELAGVNGTVLCIENGFVTAGPWVCFRVDKAYKQLEALKLDDLDTILVGFL